MPPIFSLENLHRQYLRCRRNKRTTHNALRFEAQLEEHLVRLHEELEGRTYGPSRSVLPGGELEADAGRDYPSGRLGNRMNRPRRAGR